jgi:hypothetical protein
MQNLTYELLSTTIVRIVGAMITVAEIGIIVENLRNLIHETRINSIPKKRNPVVETMIQTILYLRPHRLCSAPQHPT